MKKNIATKKEQQSKGQVTPKRLNKLGEWLSIPREKGAILDMRAVLK